MARTENRPCVGFEAQANAMGCTASPSEESRLDLTADTNNVDFRYQSTLGGLFFLWACACALPFVALDLRSPGMAWEWSWPFCEYLAVQILLPGLGLMLLYCVSDVQICDGEFRFRRLFNSTAVPLTAITKVRRLWFPPSLYLRLDDGGRRYRVVFFPYRFRLEPSVPPVVRFLSEICHRNASTPQRNRGQT